SEFLYQVMSRRTAGPYQLQAAVSALHARAPSFDRVDWPQIAGLYSALERLQPSPVVSLNHLVAMSYVDPPAQILPQLERLAEPLARYQPYYAALADIARRARQWVIAGEAYRHALDLSQNEAEREFLTRRLQALELHPDAD
ncbi:MAG: RNA polymerase subunit sigma-24, partial [Granulosicoccaceae bacterium]